MTASNIEIEPLGFPWRTPNPFLFCVYHQDNYPAGNENMGPKTGLDNRALGSDFEKRNGYRMYHGKTVPGFPYHPHRGFETITIVEKGFADHSDSLGATGRFGNGDVQWMTAGKGVQHSEMFPLINQEEENPLVLFQIWLNLPRDSKMVAPHYKMLWHEDIPWYKKDGAAVKIVAGKWNDTKALDPTPDSWAATASHDVGVFIIHLEPGAELQLPKRLSEKTNRSLYFYKGDTVLVDDAAVKAEHAIHLNEVDTAHLKNTGTEKANFLMLQGQPINEPIEQHGPFVMNYPGEIRQAFIDYQKDQFGGWPWPVAEHVHPRDKGRFAQYADGTVEERG